MPFVTAGDPDLEFTAAAIQELAARGANLIEIGFPYSDPIADGPVIQASYTRVLNKKTTVDQILAMTGKVAKENKKSNCSGSRRGADFDDADHCMRPVAIRAI